MSEEKKPIYYYKVNEQTGEIAQIKITEYVEYSPDVCRWELPNGYTKYAHKWNFDLLKHNEMYSYSCDMESITNKICAAYMNKRDKAEQEHNRWQTVIENICRQYANNLEVTI